MLFGEIPLPKGGLRSHGEAYWKCFKIEDGIYFDTLKAP